jgi:hypothetical protein
MEVLGGKALTEKLPGLVPFPVVMRVIIPGAVVVLSLLPIIWPLVRNIPLLSTWATRAVVGSLLVLGTGITLSLMSGLIYQVYEGYFLWPGVWFKKGVQFQRKKVSRKLEADDELRKALKQLSENELEQDQSEMALENAAEDEDSEDTESQEERDSSESNEYNYLKLCYDKLWLWLKMFPVDDEGYPVAKCPTLLGNILKSYEDYPSTRYGMDAGFYWPRLWLSLEDDKKKMVDTRWSVADGILYSSFGLAFSAAIYFLLAIANLGIQSLSFLGLVQRTMLGELLPKWTVLIAVTMVFAAYLTYRLSLPYHRQNGESFMTLFDLYRDNLSSMQDLGDAEKRKWDTIWAYLQYLRIQCECDKSYPANLQECPECATKTEANLKRARAAS